MKIMMTKRKLQNRAEDKLSKERIIVAAIDILDRDGESALTFRTLATALSTGSGAIYWYVENKTELLLSATDVVMNLALGKEDHQSEPAEIIRVIALAVFDVIDSHPWVGNQLIREPWRGAMLRLGERIGGQLHRMGIFGPDRFDIWSALFNYILGVAGQNAANVQTQPPGADRETQLTAVAEKWLALPVEKYPFMIGLAEYLPVHDDRQQFLAGIDLILKGIRHRTEG